MTGAGQNVGSGIADALAVGATVLVNDVVAERATAVTSRIGAAEGPRSHSPSTSELQAFASIE